MERRLAVLAGPHRHALIAVLVVGAAGSAAATPRTKAAKPLFDRGVTAYMRGEFAAAADLFARSFAVEADPDTLFGWAQAERRLDHCDKAIALYEKLLGLNIPEENKQAVQAPLAECKQALAEPVPAPAPAAPAPVAAEPPPVAHVHLVAPEPEHRVWWRDPIGDTLVGAGVVGLGAGAVLLVSAAHADRDKRATNNYFEFQAESQRAHDRGEQGVLAVAAGGALVACGIIWYATHRDSPRAVSAWLAPSSAGLVVRARW